MQHVTKPEGQGHEFPGSREHPTHAPHVGKFPVPGCSRLQRLSPRVIRSRSVRVPVAGIHLDEASCLRSHILLRGKVGRSPHRIICHRTVELVANPGAAPALHGNEGPLSRVRPIVTVPGAIAVKHRPFLPFLSLPRPISVLGIRTAAGIAATATAAIAAAAASTSSTSSWTPSTRALCATAPVCASLETSRPTPRRGVPARHTTTKPGSEARPARGCFVRVQVAVRVKHAGRERGRSSTARSNTTPEVAGVVNSAAPIARALPTGHFLPSPPVLRSLPAQRVHRLSGPRTAPSEQPRHPSLKRPWKVPSNPPSPRGCAAGPRECGGELDEFGRDAAHEARWKSCLSARRGAGGGEEQCDVQECAGSPRGPHEAEDAPETRGGGQGGCGREGQARRERRVEGCRRGSGGERGGNGCGGRKGGGRESPSPARAQRLEDEEGLHFGEQPGTPTCRQTPARTPRSRDEEGMAVRRRHHPARQRDGPETVTCQRSAHGAPAHVHGCQMGQDRSIGHCGGARRRHGARGRAGTCCGSGIGRRKRSRRGPRCSRSTDQDRCRRIRRRCRRTCRR